MCEWVVNFGCIVKFIFPTCFLTTIHLVKRLILMPSVSVVIPYYNDSFVIRRCLESVMNQTHAVLEVLIIDDCSSDSDSLISIVNDFASMLNIQVFRNEKNMNGAYSRNVGLKNAKGEYIALLDSDDFWMSDHVEKSLKGLLIANADFVYSNMIYQNKFGVFKRKKVKAHDVACDKPADFLLKSPPQTNSFFFKKEVSIQIQFDEQLKRHQDYQFILDVVTSNFNVNYLDQYTTVYCSSPRPAKARVNFDSIFTFWGARIDMVSEHLLTPFLIYHLLMLMNFESIDLDGYINKYRCFCGVKNRYGLIIPYINRNRRMSLVFFYFVYYVRFERFKLLKKLLKIE